MSPFLEIPETEWVAHNPLAFAFRDRFPVTEGHTLVVTRREVPTWFEATPEERAAVMDLVEAVKRQLDDELGPDGYNVGFNAGEAAGQTVFHLHVHVIPRFRGDMDDPRGGVRHVIPSRGNYKLRPQNLATGGEKDPFIRLLRPLFERAQDVSVVAAFVQRSGLDRLRELIERARGRGARVRILTGDYLEITQAAALEDLLDWMSAGANGDDEDEPRLGPLEARIVEVESLPGRTRAFHPKSWRFEGQDLNVLFVGSSNLSRSALDTGVEWNLRIDKDRDADAYRAAVDAFEALWTKARLLDADWVRDYGARAARHARDLPPWEEKAEPLPRPPEPHEVQVEALERLAKSRDAGHQRGLVVLATGLGKTWLASFDVERMSAELGRPARVLFLAHRREILRQAARTFRTMAHATRPDAKVTWFVGAGGRLDGDLVFASVLKLARDTHLRALEPRAFDYVVVDEVHHATAPSYRKILDHLDPRFVLGLTATPDRADEADVQGLFDDNVVLRAGIDRGIEVGRLVPFEYFGIKDEVDYSPKAIPWRNRRFDPVALAQAVQTERRMTQLWKAWRAHPGERSLVFCASVAHANFARAWLRERGVRIDAIHTGEDADDRDLALDKLANGALDAVCSVDVLNEGVDVPSVDRVVMLRPTESPVVFLQQLGRGLRRSDETAKEKLTVIDFVGNHRIFLERIRRLLSLAGAEDRASAAFEALLAADGPLELPTGCSIEIELEAKDMLSKLRPRGGQQVERVYRELREARGERPTAGELFRQGYLPSTLSKGEHGSWFHFVESEGDLSPEEQDAFRSMERFLAELETSAMTKSFKMVLLEAMLEADGLRDGLDLETLARRSHRVLRRDPTLWAEVAEPDRFEALTDDNSKAWVAYWKKNPVTFWCKKDKRSPRPWFRLEGQRFVPNFDWPGSEAAVDLVRELVDYRLARYRRGRSAEVTTSDFFDCKITWNKRDPIIKLPSAKARPDVPRSDVDVRLRNGELWTFGFRKEFCNVARPAGTDRNRLPDLLRGWFGPNAGHPGTDFRVRFSPSPDGLWVEPLGQVIAFASRGRLRSYPDLRAAAGAALEGHESIEADEVVLPTRVEGGDVFSVRAAGDSMDGGSDPIHDGDWLVLRLCRGDALPAVEGRVALVQRTDAALGSRFQLKRVVKDEQGWLLKSDNPEAESFRASADTVPIAKLVEHLSPEQIAPPEGTLIAEDDLAATFGLDERPETGRYGGHLFFMVDRPGALVAPDRLKSTVRPKPGETAFVLTRLTPDARWRYCGVARQTETDGQWSVPSLDHPTYKAIGSGRAASRTLSAEALARAEAVAQSLLDRNPPGTWLEARGRRCRLLGPAARGGIRIDGGDTGFTERTVSLVDIAWALLARDDVEMEGGLLDEARVNRLRYLVGTPKGSTRWIDTGWALALIEAGRVR